MSVYLQLKLFILLINLKVCIETMIGSKYDLFLQILYIETFGNTPLNIRVDRKELITMDEYLYTDKTHIANQRFDGIEVKQVIVVKLLKGEGTHEDPCRFSEVYFDIDGQFICEIDEWLESQKSTS